MKHGHTDLGAEGILLAGAGRALLLQIANPAVGRGVAEHSTFTDRPLHRLMGTLTYVYAVVYGSEEQVRAARRRVNRAHARVRSGPEAGTPGYSAFDPELQLWVAATLYDTAAVILTRVYGPLDDETADAMYREYAKLGTALQLPARMWPGDRAAFGRYWEEHLAALRADDAAVRTGRSLLYPATAPLWYRALMPSARFMTAGLLTEQLRDDFGLPWNARSERRFQPDHVGAGRDLSAASPARAPLGQGLLFERAGVVRDLLRRRPRGQQFESFLRRAAGGGRVDREGVPRVLLQAQHLVATSSRRSPGTRRRPPYGSSPACSGVMRARRVERNCRTSARLSIGTRYDESAKPRGVWQNQLQQGPHSGARSWV